MKWILIILILICIPFVSLSQTSIEDYRSEVVAYSLKLKKVKAQTLSASESVGLAQTGFLPTLAASGSFVAQARKTEGVERWTFNLQPQIIQTLYSGGSVKATAEKAELNYQRALLSEEYTLLSIYYAADYAYWNLVAMRNYRDAVLRYVDIICSLKEVVDLRFKEGYISKGDVLMVETRLSEAEYQLISTEQNYTIALQNFNILRGFDPELPITQNENQVDIRIPQRVDLEDILSRRPDFLASTLQMDVASASVKIARANYNPSVNVGIGGDWRPYTPNRTGATQVNGNVFLNLSVPIFHFGERHRAVGIAQASYMQSEYEMLELYDQILKDESNIWSKIVDSNAQMLAAEKSLTIAGENLDISTYSYNEGLTTILDVMQAQISWIQLYTNFIASKFNYRTAISYYNLITANNI